MQVLSNAKTKEFAKLFQLKDALGVETFTDKNEAYKEIYRVFKGRFYFTEADNFDFQMSPDNKTAALICLLNEIDPAPRAKGTNLEIHIARADYEGNFHRTEQIRYDFYDDMKFDYLENDAVIMHCEDTPHIQLRRKLKALPRELTLSAEELTELLMKEAKMDKLRAAKQMHYQTKISSGTLITPQVSVAGTRISAAKSKLAPMPKQKSSLRTDIPKRLSLDEWNYVAIDTMSIL